MSLPFAADQFFDVFRQYNEETWPMPLVLEGVGLAAVALLALRRRGHERALNLILVFLWGWMGLAYQLMFFLVINPAALLFALAFFAQALVILLTGVYGTRLRYEMPRDRRGVLGAVLIAYGLAAYPLLSVWLGAWPEAPTFGLPCPTTIFTVGVFCFLRAPFPRYVLLVPALWSVVGSSAVVQFGLLQDLGLAVAGLVALRLMIRWRPASKVAYS
jgi:hypothetical protein